MTGAPGHQVRIVGGAGSGPPTAGVADEAGAGLPEGVSLTRQGALRIEGRGGLALLLEPLGQAGGPVELVAAEPAGSQAGAPEEGGLDPEALEAAARILAALGGPRPPGTETSAGTAGPDDASGLAGAFESQSAVDGPAVGAQESSGSLPVQGLEGDEHGEGPEEGDPLDGQTEGCVQSREGPEEDEDPQVTGVWIDPDDPPLGEPTSVGESAVEDLKDAQRSGDAEGIEGAEASQRAAVSSAAHGPEGVRRSGDAGAEPSPASPVHGSEPPVPAGAVQDADAEASGSAPGAVGASAGPAAPTGAPPPDSVTDLPVFSGFPEPEPGSGRRRRSPRSAASASAVAGAASAASGSVPLPGAVPEPPSHRGAATGPAEGSGVGDGAGHGRAASPGGAAAGGGTPMPASPGEGDSGAAAWDESEARRSTAVIPAALAALGAAPIVLASLCPRGHANPPDLGQCVRCGHGLLGDFRQVPRPVLVTLDISSGEQVPVAGDVVVGRAPQPPVGADAHLVALVSVPSATHLVSRSHLIFTTAEWNVFVQDLGSSNGTVLARPGHAAVLLPPYVPTPLLVGDLLDVGDGVTIHVEAPR